MDTMIAKTLSAPAATSSAALTSSSVPTSWNGHGYGSNQGTTVLFPARSRAIAAFATPDMTAAVSAVAVGVLGTDERGTVIPQGPPRADLC